MKNHQPLLTIFKNAIIVVDEFNRIKETEETLTTEVEDFMSNLIEVEMDLSDKDL